MKLTDAQMFSLRSVAVSLARTLSSSRKGKERSSAGPCLCDAKLRDSRDLENVLKKKPNPLFFPGDRAAIFLGSSAKLLSGAERPENPSREGRAERGEGVPQLDSKGHAPTMRQTVAGASAEASGPPRHTSRAPALPSPHHYPI